MVPPYETRTRSHLRAMDSFANFLPTFVAFGLPTKKAEDGPTDLTEFPDEKPSKKQLQDWLYNIDPIIRRTYGALVRGDTPAHLVSAKAAAERDLTNYVELPIPVGVPAAAGREMQANHTISHNLRIKGMREAKSLSQTYYDQSMAEMKDGLARMLITLMRPRAAKRLAALLTKHKVADNLYDGRAMYIELVELQSSLGVHEAMSREQRAMIMAAMEPVPVTVPITGGSRTSGTHVAAIPGAENKTAAVSKIAESQATAAAKKAKAAAAALSTTIRSNKVGLLPQGTWCNDNTCPYDHEGVICYSNPRTTQAQVEESNPRLAADPVSIRRFNKNKEKNVSVRNVCDRSQLVLYDIPPPQKARPAKNAVPFEEMPQHTKSTDGMPSLNPDTFYSIPSAPAVVVDLKNMTETMTLPCISVMQPFAGRILSLDKTWDSKCRNVLGPYLGG